MTYKKFFNQLRFRTKTDTGVWPDAEMLEMVNMIKDDLALKITKANEDYFVMPYLRDLRAGQKEYYLPERMMAHIKKLEVDLVGEDDGEGCQRANADNYKEAREVDISEEKRIYIPTKPEQKQTISSGNEVLYRISRDSIILVTNKEIINVYDGLRLHAETWPRDLEEADVTRDIQMSIDLTDTSFSMPREIHMSFLLYVSAFYKQSREKPIPLFEDEKNIMVKINEDILTMSPVNLDREQIGQIPFDDGYDY